MELRIKTNEINIDWEIASKEQAIFSFQENYNHFRLTFNRKKLEELHEKIGIMLGQ